jgi:hypothetical protein
MSEGVILQTDVPGSSKGAPGARASGAPAHPGAGRSSLPGFLSAETSPSVASNARSQPARTAPGGTRSSGSSSHGQHARPLHPQQPRVPAPPSPAANRQGHGSHSKMQPRPSAPGSSTPAAGSTRPSAGSPPQAADGGTPPGGLQLPFDQDVTNRLTVCMEELAAGQLPQPRLDNNRTPDDRRRGPLPVHTVTGAEAWTYWPCNTQEYLGGRRPGGVPEMVVPAALSRALIPGPTKRRVAGAVTLVVAVPHGAMLPQAAAAHAAVAGGPAAAAAAEGRAPPSKLPAALLPGQWVEAQRVAQVEFERGPDGPTGQAPTRMDGRCLQGLACWSDWSQLALELVS